MRLHTPRPRQRALIALAALAVAAVAVIPTAHARPADTKLETGLAAIHGAGAPGALALVTTTAGSVTTAVGTADIRQPGALRPDAPFRAGSITKTLTAALVLQLVAEKRLRLSDTVGRWLPGLLARGDEITIRQLLQHTSGLRDYADGPGASKLFAPLLRDRDHRFTPRELVRTVAQAPLQFEPGSGWAYSNTNYVLLGMILEQATGEQLSQLLDDRILRPLHLRHTSLPNGAALPLAGVHGYLLPGNPLLPAPGGAPVDVTKTSPSWTWAAGALVSTPHEISRFYRALLGGRLLPTRLLTEMTHARPTSAGRGYGLGLLEVDTPCGPVVGHDGEIFGYTTIALTTRDGQRSTVLLANASHAPINDGAKLLTDMVTLATRALCATDET